MKYRITKDCGTGWDDALGFSAAAWGVSESQRSLVERVAPGDVLLHYIDHAHAWAGYSRVGGAVQDNRRDSQRDWLAALPFAIPIEPGVWLDEGRCELTVVVPGLPDKHYERQVAFTSIPAAEAVLIIEAIETADTSRCPPSPRFHERWKQDAESYYKGIVKALADGRCRLCGKDAAAWIARAALQVSVEEAAAIRGAFLDAAHIVSARDHGPMTPDNLRALCPNCHRIIDRLPAERRQELLRGI